MTSTTTTALTATIKRIEALYAHCTAIHTPKLAYGCDATDPRDQHVRDYKAHLKDLLKSAATELPFNALTPELRQFVDPQRHKHQTVANLQSMANTPLVPTKAGR